ncbi:site-specific integrase [Azospirillum sp. sgz301742]
MNSQIQRPTVVDDLPRQALTSDGIAYDPRDDEWQILTTKRRFHFNFQSIEASSLLLVSLKKFMVHLLRTGAPSTAQAKYRYITSLLRHIAEHDPWTETITQAHLANHRASLGPRGLYDTTHLHQAICQWARLGIPGVSDEAFAYAREASRHRHPAGKAVRQRDPHKGPFSDLEYDGICKALHVAFAEGNVSIADYSLCLLSIALGARPEQFASLWLKDLKIVSASAGISYVLAVPRAKGGRRFRAQFTDRPLTEEIGIVIEAQARLVRDIALAAGMERPEEAPLFPARRKTALFYGEGTAPVQMTPSAIGRQIMRCIGSLRVRSERTGMPINFTATRARRTVGTRAALEGRSLAEIASLLDHSTLDSARIYIELRGQLLERLDKKLALHLAPLAQRFAGTLIPRGQDAAQGIARHVVSPIGQAVIDIGGCSKHSLCGMGKPIACYTCRLFRPWLDGPHEAVLDDLIERRERMAGEGSIQVAVGLDDTIVACAEVVRQCYERKSVAEELSHG